MPELPDLEVFATNLEKRFKNKELKEIHFSHAGKLNVPVAEAKKTLEGQKVSTIYRSGKTLHFKFKDDNILQIHLMLHGEIHLSESDEKLKSELFRLTFKDSFALILTDFQKAATATLNPEVPDVPDAFSPKLSAAQLKEILAKKKGAIKTVLLDQKVLRGIGIAYADEILWKSRISPFSVSKNIPEDQVSELAKAIHSVLANGIKQIKKSNPDQISGEVRDFMAIHNNKKKESPAGSTIIIDKKSSRKTYYTDEQVLY